MTYDYLLQLSLPTTRSELLQAICRTEAMDRRKVIKNRVLNRAATLFTAEFF
jgi:hypothetical protein